MAMLVPLDFLAQRPDGTGQPDLKKLAWLAECEEIAYHEVFDTTYTWKFLHRMEAVWKKEFGLRPAGLDEVLDYCRPVIPAGRDPRSISRPMHDENSHSGSEYERMGDAAKAFAVLVLYLEWQVCPLIYSGQEIAESTKRLKFFDKDPIPWDGRVPAPAWIL